MAVTGLNLINNMNRSAGLNPSLASFAEEESKVNFGDILKQALNNVNSLEQESSRMTEDFIAGKTDNIHAVMIAGEKSSLALSLVMEVRNKLMESYQEIMRMQV